MITGLFYVYTYLTHSILHLDQIQVENKII